MTRCLALPNESGLCYLPKNMAGCLRLTTVITIASTSHTGVIDAMRVFHPWPPPYQFLIPKSNPQIVIQVVPLLSSALWNPTCTRNPEKREIPLHERNPKGGTSSLGSVPHYTHNGYELGKQKAHTSLRTCGLIVGGGDYRRSISLRVSVMPPACRRYRYVPLARPLASKVAS
ncbi:MAG: hypothetical protein HW412_2659 [Bacteroidetes bacterium]|nr:hypothetical protein [Bacteroidota bacterium]